MAIAELRGKDFAHLLEDIDGYLCELTGAQIRDGLHILGDAPLGEARVNLVLAILRSAQLFGGSYSVPGLRSVLASEFNLSEADLLTEPGRPSPVRPELREVIYGPSATASDVIDLLYCLARRVVLCVETHTLQREHVSDVVVVVVCSPAPTVHSFVRFPTAL